jgi:hypothetical protein
VLAGFARLVFEAVPLALRAVGWPIVALLLALRVVAWPIVALLIVGPPIVAMAIVGLMERRRSGPLQ